MVLLSNTVLFYENTPINYEILLTKGMLLFKPYFYHTREEHFPCIVLARFGTEWKVQERIARQLEEQVMEDIEQLHIDQMILKNSNAHV